MGRFGEPARLFEGDGRVAGAGWTGGLYEAAGRADLSIHQAARGPRAGQGDVLCNCVSVPDGRDSGAGEVGFVPADQGGRQSGTPDVEGQVGRIYAGDAA